MNEDEDYDEDEEEMEADGKIIYLIQVIDKSPYPPLTTIACDSKGWNIHWGSSTPVELKALIEDAMTNN